MPLIPTSWTTHTTEVDSTPEGYTEPVSKIVVTEGRHDCGLVIRKEQRVISHTDITIHQEIEDWEYLVADPRSAPLRYSRRILSTVPLPGTPAGLRQVERTVAQAYPYTPLAPDGTCLSWQSRTWGYAVYSRRHSETATPSAEEQQHLQDLGLNPSGPPGVIVSTARRWSEAHHQGQVLPEETGRQVSILMLLEVETEVVHEQPRHLVVYRTTKNLLRGGDVHRSGPEHRDRPSWSYRLPVEVEPPTVSVSRTDGGLQITISGGGCTIAGYRVRVQQYQLQRRVISEPTPERSGDPYGLWDESPATPPTPTSVITTTSTDLSGAPASPVPGAAGHVEPGDPSPPEPAGWSVVGESANSIESAQEPGRAVVTDVEVLGPGGTYEYRAIAVIGDNRSEPGSAVRAVYAGDRSARSGLTLRSRVTDTAVEVEALAPDDGSRSYGETRVFRLPARGYPAGQDDTDGAADDWREQLVEELARRQIASSQDRSSQLRITVPVPLLGLQRGQTVRLGPAAWRSVTAGISVIAELDTDCRWRVEGWTIGAGLGEQGLTSSETTIELSE